MSNTKIVLNRQSDLILDSAKITKPEGIVKADIPELVGDLSNLVVADAAEASARVAGDASLEAKHNAEMSTEVAARIAGDAAIQAEVDALEVEHAADVSTAAENLAAEASRAQAAEGSLATALANEVAATDSDFAAMDAAYKAADASMETKHNAEMSTETSARVAGDVLLQTNIDAEKARIDAILDASTADSDSFAEIVALINSVDTTNDQAFAAYVLSNDAALSTEVERTDEVEEALYSLETIHYDLENALDAEASERKAGDALLDGKIADIISNTDITSMDSFSEVSAEISSQVSYLEVVDDKLASNMNALKTSLQNADDAIVASANAALDVLDNNILNVAEFVNDVKPRMRGFNELPDGVATAFTTDVYESQIVFLNGLMQLEGVDYTFATAGDAEAGFEGTVTFASAPAATDKLNIYGIRYEDYTTQLETYTSVTDTGGDGSEMGGELKAPTGGLSSGGELNPEKGA